MVWRAFLRASKLDAQRAVTSSSVMLSKTGREKQKQLQNFLALDCGPLVPRLSVTLLRAQTEFAHYTSLKSDQLTEVCTLSGAHQIPFFL